MSCSFLEQIKPELQSFANDLGSAATQAKNVEAQAKAAGYTQLAHGIAKKVKWADAQEKLIGKRLQKAGTRCSSTSG